MATCIELMREALIAATTGDATFPLRTILPVANQNSLLALMPGQGRSRKAIGVKIITIFPENHLAGLDSHQGVVVLFEAQTGYPLAIIDAIAITAIRTAAVSAVATDTLALPEASTLAILGSGVQARSHIAAMQAVRPIRHLKIWSRNIDHARALPDSLALPAGVSCDIVSTVQAAVREADIVCATTAAPAPIVQAQWLKPGTHINAVGACTPTTREFDSETLRASKIFVDCYESAFNEAGEILIPIAEGLITKKHVLAELGEVLNGQKRGRSSAGELTFFKSLGIAAEDLVAAHHIYQSARAKGIGQTYNFEGRS